jgi:hypothetical protein
MIITIDGLAIREMLTAWQHRPDAPRCMCGSPPLIAVRVLRTSYSPFRRPLDGLAGPWWPFIGRGHKRCQGASATAWTGCAAERRHTRRI